jgi:hypothetical protein
MKFRQLTATLVTVASLAATARAATVGLWLFDEQEGIYPSSLLKDASENNYFLVLGRGAEIVPGRFGHALHPAAPAPFEPRIKGKSASQLKAADLAMEPGAEDLKDAAGTLTRFGLAAPPKAPGRSMEPMTWYNATFAAMFTSGENHLRHAPFANAAATKLNLGAENWTTEFWLKLDAGASGEGVVLEIGSGPRGENETVTRLILRPAEGKFVWQNQAAANAAPIELATDMAALRSGWAHCAFVHDAARGELRHYLNGKLVSQAPTPRWAALPAGDEAYFSLGRDGHWNRPLPAAIDELRISDAALYQAGFVPPASFASRFNGSRPPHTPVVGPPLLFPGNTAPKAVVDLGGRKHVFLDDVLIAERQNITFTGHPPRIAERVLDAHGWISVEQDDAGLIHLYTAGPKDSLQVWTSKDGVHFDAPDLGHGEYHGFKNIITTEPASVGSILVDPNAVPAERWKFVTGLRGRGGVTVYTSPDGFAFKRGETLALPFWTGSGTTVFYDDQRQTYVVHNRSDFYRTPGGKNERCQLLTEVPDLMEPWPFTPVTPEHRAEVARTTRVDSTLDPAWLDNGPLAPGGFTLEYPVGFRADPAIDPAGTDVYNSRAIKYRWAPDTYVAFPLMYFHYEGEGPAQREVLAREERGLGSGIVETQLAVSRDGLNWKRLPRPAYVAPANVDGYPMIRPYTGFGLIRRGDEIWQYCAAFPSYHSPFKKEKIPETIFRLVQRLDGFVSADAPYTGGSFTTKPLRFAGNRLVLNVDTGAAGFAQVGFIDEAGKPVPGFTVDDCVYVNGRGVEQNVEWLGRDGKSVTDLSALAGKTLRLVVRMRGASLYALQFVQK